MSARRRGVRAVLLGSCLLAAVGPWAATSTARAQPVDATVGAGVEVQRIGFGDDAALGMKALSLLTVPFAARVTVDGVSGEIAGHWASGTLERPGGSETTLSGLTDTRLVVGLTVLPGVAGRIEGIAVLPTGQAEQSLEETEVAGAIASDVLPFRVSNWGSGGGFGARVSGARRFGRGGLGIAVGYFSPGEFDAVEGLGVTYAPGANVSVETAADLDVGRAGKVALRLGVQRYGDDAVESVDVFRSGTRVHAMGSYAFAAGSRSGGMVYGGLLHRGAGVAETALLEAALASARDVVMAGALVRTRWRGALLTPQVDLRAVRSDDGIGQGYDVRVGIGAEVAAGDATLLPTLRVHVGSAEARAGAESGFTGLDIGLSARFGRGGGR